MLKCISYWSMKNGPHGMCPMDAALKAVAKAGFAGIELCIGVNGSTDLLHIESTQSDCQTIRREVDLSGLICQTTATGLTWECNLVSNDPAVRKKSIDIHARALHRTAWLGCSAMLIVPGVVGCPFVPDEHVRYDLAIERCREAMKPLLDTAERVGVNLCLENVWNGMFLSPIELCDFIDSFGSERLGSYFDVGNVLGYHQYPPHWIELLGKRIKRVHIKDFSMNSDGTADTVSAIFWPATYRSSRAWMPCGRSVTTKRSLRKCCRTVTDFWHKPARRWTEFSRCKANIGEL